MAVMTKHAGKKDLRSGYTTGACAAAAAKAAALALVRQTTVTRSEITLPGGGSARFPVGRCDILPDRAACSVIKDAGDDPDVTDGAEIIATVILKGEPGITIGGGQGVGTVTKPGLEVPVGEAAINPVPRRMIAAAVESVLREQAAVRGVDVIIAVHNGEKLAEKTLNKRIGIVGGISIIGTTGIVVPYSVEAYKASISQALDIAVACGGRHIILTTGRRSEKFAQAEMALPDECFIQAGDFIGYSLDECAGKKVEKVTVWGMTGKISKLAAGDLYTNISDSRVDIGFLVEVAAGCGLTPEEIGRLRQAVTANHLRRLLPEHCVTRFCDKLCRLAAKQCRARVGYNVKIRCVMSDYNGNVIGRCRAR